MAAAEKKKEAPSAKPMGAITWSVLHGAGLITWPWRRGLNQGCGPHCATADGRNAASAVDDDGVFLAHRMRLAEPRSAGSAVANDRPSSYLCVARAPTPSAMRETKNVFMLTPSCSARATHRVCKLLDTRATNRPDSPPMLGFGIGSLHACATVNHAYAAE